MWRKRQFAEYIGNPQKEFPKFVQHEGILQNGHLNDRPDFIETVIDESPLASQCADIYCQALEGAGFEVDLDNINLSSLPWKTYTPNDLLKEICESCSRHEGAFIHISYNANLEKSGIKLLPYCRNRVGKYNSYDYNGKVVYSPRGWENRFYHNQDTQVFYSYNPIPEVLQAQIEHHGGIEKYPGQVYYFKFSDKYAYSQSRIERALQNALADNEINNYYYSSVVNNFHDLTVIRHLPFDNQRERQEFSDQLKDVTSARRAGSFLLVEDDFSDIDGKGGRFVIENIKTEVNPERYKHIEDMNVAKIRKAYKNIPPQLIEQTPGKLGNTNGDELKNAIAIYNMNTSSERKKIERLFSELFRNYERVINPTNNWKIALWTIEDDGTIEKKEEEPMMMPIDMDEMDENQNVEDEVIN